MAEIRRVVTIAALLTGSPATGRSISDVTVALKRESGASLVAATETVTLSEIGSGLYWIKFTPEHAGLYALSYVPADPDTYLVEPEDGFQVQVGLDFAEGQATYLCTLDEVKLALNIADAGDDDRLNALIADVTALCETYCRRPLRQSSAIELIDPGGASALQVKRWPIASITSIHESADVPRLYDSTTLLTVDTDYLAETDSGIIWRLDDFWESGPQTVRIEYTGGYSPVPEDLNRAAIEIVCVKWQKGKYRQYHVTGLSGEDGAISGVVFDDIPMNTRLVLDRYAERSF